MKNIDTSDSGVLKRFMKEFFPYTQLKQAGFFTKEMKGNYELQAKRVCEIFGYKTVYEYGAITTQCHISYGDKKQIQDEPFITVFKSIYE